MSPFNWGLSSLRDRPTKIKSLGYVADGLGVLRWDISATLKFVNKKVVRLGSDLILGVEKMHDVVIRRKRKKKNARVLIYSKMPLEIFEENRSYFSGKEKAVFVGTLPDWHDRIFLDPDLLPEDIREKSVTVPEPLLVKDSRAEAILAAEYGAWEKTPRELKKYVITPDELRDLLRHYSPPSVPE
jgi:hypothetical protein